MHFWVGYIVIQSWDPIEQVFVKSGSKFLKMSLQAIHWNKSCLECLTWLKTIFGLFVLKAKAEILSNNSSWNRGKNPKKWVYKQLNETKVA